MVAGQTTCTATCSFLMLFAHVGCRERGRERTGIVGDGLERHTQGGLHDGNAHLPWHGLKFQRLVTEGSVGIVTRDIFPRGRPLL